MTNTNPLFLYYKHARLFRQISMTHSRLHATELLQTRHPKITCKAAPCFKSRDAAPPLQLQPTLNLN
jgi:hypothetical protein